MKTQNLTKEDKELIELAKTKQMYARVEKKQLMADVCSVVKMPDGKIYTGSSLAIKNSGSGSICGEQSALSNVVNDGEKKIDTIVAVWVSKDYMKNKKWNVIQPCGACRHTISHFGNPWVIISRNKKTKLSELYPMPVK